MSESESLAIGGVRRETPPKPCPLCSSSDVARIVYGYPSPALYAESEIGAVVLGGCNVADDSPVWKCRACQATFGRWIDDR